MKVEAFPGKLQHVGEPVKKPDTRHISATSRQSPAGSDRAFGITFAVVFTVIALWPLMDGDAPRWWSIMVAAAFLGTAFVWPTLLAPLNRVWMAFARLLHSVMTPVIMAVLFYLTVTPTALIMRLFGKAPIPLGLDRQAKSYWIRREPPGPAPESMKNQF